MQWFVPQLACECIKVTSVTRNMIYHEFCFFRKNFSSISVIIFDTRGTPSLTCNFSPLRNVCQFAFHMSAKVSDLRISWILRSSIQAGFPPLYICFSPRRSLLGSLYHVTCPCRLSDYPPFQPSQLSNWSALRRFYNPELPRNFPNDSVLVSEIIWTCATGQISYIIRRS